MNLFAALLIFFVSHKTFHPIQSNFANSCISPSRSNAKKESYFYPPTTPSVQVFARFSPLIGGVKFVPIHVEIMLLLVDVCSSKASTSPNVVNRAMLHRIDFVPQNPENADTILQLLALQDVAGVIRHRILAVGTIERNEEESFETLISMDRLNSLLETRVSSALTSIVVPLGEAFFEQTFDERMTDISSIKGIIESVEEKNGSKLNLIRNNCYSFALDILSNLNMTYYTYPKNQP